MAKCNGHDSRTAWNVSLWINNDEGLYNLARDCIRQTKSKDAAAAEMMNYLPPKTPDGYRYTVSTVRKAIRGM
jgi:hypothetical protein